MDSMDWEPWGTGEDDYPEYDAESLGDFLVPGLSPSVAVAKRLLGTRRPQPARRYGAAMRAPIRGPVSTQGRMQQLAQQQRASTTQLAVRQQQTAAQQSSETFGPAATAAIGAFALAAKGNRNDVFAATLTHGLPILQLLTSSRGRAITAGFKANPLSTIAFPVVALLATAFKDQIPGFRKPKVEKPGYSRVPDDKTAGDQIIDITGFPPGAKLYQSNVDANPGDPTTPYDGGGVRVARGKKVKFIVEVDGVKSEPITVNNPN